MKGRRPSLFTRNGPQPPTKNARNVGSFDWITHLTKTLGDFLEVFGFGNLDLLSAARKMFELGLKWEQLTRTTLAVSLLLFQGTEHLGCEVFNPNNQPKWVLSCSPVCIWEKLRHRGSSRAE